MAKNFRRMLAMVLVMCMFVSALPMQALAAEGEDVPFTTTDTLTGGDVSITVESSGSVTVEGTNGSGESVSITGNTSDSGTTLSGKVDSETDNYTYTESVSTSTTTHPDGSTQTVTVTEGSETKEWTGEGVENVKGYEDEDGNKPVELPPIEVVVKPDEQTIVKDSVIIEGTIGDIKEGDNDTEYDYTDVTIEVDRTVSAEISKIEENVVIDPAKGNLECPVESENYDGKEQPKDWDPKDLTDRYHPGLQFAGKDILKDYDKPTTEGFDQGYDMLWSGVGEYTYGASAVVVKNPVWMTDANGEYLLDENGEKILNWAESTFAKSDESHTTITKEDGTQEDIGFGMFLAPSQFMLEHENGNYFYAYCMDASTTAQPTQNQWYRIMNIESVIEPDEGDKDPNTYITEEQAGMIRAIANAGYWGTNGKEENGDTKYELDEDGKTKYQYVTDKEGNIVYQVDENGDFKTDAEGNKIPETTPVIRQGSIESLKALLMSVYEEDDQFTVNYPGYSDEYSKEHFTYDIHSLINNLTESEALTATQAAIWHFANYEDVNLKTNKGGTVVGLYNGIRGPNSSETGFLLEFVPAIFADESYFGEGEYDKKAFGESDARMQALFQALLGLSPIYEDGANRTDTTVFPSEDVINDVSLTISDRATDNAFNKDVDATNDVYNASISFTLAFTPGENDEFFIELTNGDKEDPQPIVDANNNPIKKKLVNAEKYAEATEDEKKSMLCANSEGVYTLTGLELSENDTHTLEIRLDGKQYLDSGVYIYQACDPNTGEPTRAASQTLVGLAKGTQHVTVTSKFDVKFDVNEQNKVVTEHFWRYEEDPVITPPSPPEYPVTPMDYVEEDVPAPQVFRLNNQNEELVEIPEEPVPLATPVVTGDNSGLWVAVILIALCGIVAVNVFDKKRQHESF